MTQPLTAHHVIGTQAMYRADATTIERGISGFDLMCNAARAVVQTILQEQLLADRTIVICGKGNNGGDGFVVAHLLRESGCSVDVVFAGSEEEIEQLSGDAKLAAELYLSVQGSSLHYHTSQATLHNSSLSRLLIHADSDGDIRDVLIIDALFGAGLNRPIAPANLMLLKLINQSSHRTLSIDLPSGVIGDTGSVVSSDSVLPCDAPPVEARACAADLTVTFFRKKPGHLLEPGKRLCGKVIVCDIGIADDVLGCEDSVFVENHPSQWCRLLPQYTGASHKYTRGHVLSFSGPRHATGAARLAAHAALRVGAGLVTLASPKGALDINASHVTEIMQHQVDTPDMLKALLCDHRLNALVIGPGFGVGTQTMEMTLTALDANRACVIDADALTSFAENPERLFGAIHRCDAPVVLTPHDGEFQRLFSDICQTAKHERASAAAKRSGAIIVLKGSDTVIACPQGPISVNSNAPAWLSTAGSGDVLAGTIAGLLAQHDLQVQAGPDGFAMSYAMSCAGVWMHGDAASRHGPGLIASDIDTFYPEVLGHLLLQNS